MQPLHPSSVDSDRGASPGRLDAQSPGSLDSSPPHLLTEQSSMAESTMHVRSNESLSWQSCIQHSSQLLIAVIDPHTLTLRYANDRFCHLTGLNPDGEHFGSDLSTVLTEPDYAVLQQLYRRHVLGRVWQTLYQLDLETCRLLEEPILLTLTDSARQETCYVQLWLRSDQLRISRLDPQVDEFADLGLHHLSPEALANQLNDPDQVEALEKRLNLENYGVSGWLLLEGLDITVQETVHRITQLLIDRDSILQAEKFEQINQYMKRLFRAQNTVILSLEADDIRLFIGSVSEELDAATYSLQSLQGSHFIRAIEENRITLIPDLSQDYKTECGKALVDLGVRSLLLMPLVTYGKELHHAAQPVGLVGLISDRPHQFDGLDCRRATQLIPAFATALTVALRQMLQKRFINNIHPAVEWRFAQEAERRSWGLPPEPIVFNAVYPLYGISDIRGSSAERNRAIQSDLLEQFRLAIAVIEAVCQVLESALTEQIRLDLLEYVHRLETEITVDAEVTAMRYLRDRVEVYFKGFEQCSPAAQAAIAAYRNACDNDHHCVYQARACYDTMLHQINSRLRDTWEVWQQRMQNITPHYCDTESTDGIDHMIYAGASIDPEFSDFHLRSLRYEQLRAVCDCARTAFHIQSQYSTNLEVTHLVLVQDTTVDIFHDEETERLFDVRGTRDTRYEIVKKRIDKAVDEQTQTRITQPGMLTLVYSTDEEWREYQQYLHYLHREGWVDNQISSGTVEPLQGVNGLKFARVAVFPAEALHASKSSDAFERSETNGSSAEEPEAKA